MAIAGLSKGLFSGLEGTFQNLLQMLPDQIMAANAPEFLKIAAMQQQGKAREAMTAAVPPSTTVAQDVVQQSVASSGIGALPTSPAPVASPPALAAAPMPTAHAASGGVIGLPSSPDMYSDRYYADGGIVAFAEGGSTEEEEDEAPNPFVSTYRRIINPAYRGVKSFMYGLVPDPDDQAVLDRSQIGAKWYSGPEGTPATYDYGRKMGDKGSEDISVSAIPSQFLPSMGDIRGGIGSIEIDTPQMEYTPFEPPKEQTRSEVLAQRRQDLQEAGVDPEARMAKKRERVGKLEERFEQESERAPWLALAQAGLAMAQTPGTFGQALATGAQTGLNDYLRATKDLKADERELVSLQDALDDAEYAEKMGDVTAVREARARAEEARVRAAEINFKGRMDVEQYNKSQQFEAEKLKLQEQGRREELAALQAYRAADIAKEYAKLQATIGQARTEAMAKIATAANKGALTEKDMLTYLQEESERIKRSPEFKEMFADREGATAKEMDVEAFRIAQGNLAGLQVMMYDLQNVRSAMGGLGALQDTSGFTLRPAQ